MKKIYVISAVLMLTLGGCAWLASHGVGGSGNIAPKAQFCPDDPFACR